MKRYVAFIAVFLIGFLTMDTIQAKTGKNTSPFEYVTVPEGEKACRITEIRIKKDKGISVLKIPDTINGKTVVSIGPGLLDEDNEDPVLQNVFGLYEWVDGDESYENWKSRSKEQKRRAMKVEKVILPDTIKKIREYCFATLKNLKTVKLPKGLTAVGERAFITTPRLRKIHIPASVKEGLTGMKEADFLWKHVTISKKNPYYKMKKGMIFSKDGKAVYALMTAKKNIRIPDGVKRLEEGAFYNKPVQSVYLGAGVREIKYGALSTKTACRVTLSAANPYLAKSGMCIYNRKKKSLLVGIPKSRYENVWPKITKQKIYYLKIPRKVKELDNDVSIVGVGKKYKVRKVYIPKSVETIVYGWSISGFVHKKCTYITERDYWTFRP